MTRNDLINAADTRSVEAWLQRYGADLNKTVEAPRPRRVRKSFAPIDQVIDHCFEKTGPVRRAA